MAIEPKSPRKRAVKKIKAKVLEAISDLPAGAATEEPAKTRKRAAAIPVPVFQAAEATDAPVKAARRSKAKSSPEEDTSAPTSATDDESDSDPRNRNRRRRRGGRGRRRPQDEGIATDSTEDSDEPDSE